MDYILLYSDPAFSQFLSRFIVDDLFPDFFFKYLICILSDKASLSWLLTSIQLLLAGRHSTLKTFSLQQFHSSLVCARCDTWWA